MEDQNAIAQGIQSRVASMNPADASGGFGSTFGTQQTMPQPTAPSGGNFFEHIGHSVASLASDVPKLATGLFHTVVSPVINFGKALVNTADGHYYSVLDAQMQQSNDNSAQVDALTKSYRNGGITPEEFHNEMALISKSNTDISNNISAVSQATNASAVKNIAIDAAYTALLPFTVLRGAELSLESGGTALTRLLARSPTLYKSAESVQSVAFKVPGLEKLIKATPEGTTLKGTLFNVAVKNPVMLNLSVQYLVQLMQEVADGKYGQAAVGAGLIGLMPFVGGPLGAAGRWGKNIINKVAMAAYGKTGFVDELNNVLGGKLIPYLEDLKNSKASKPNVPEVPKGAATYYHGGTPIDKASIAKSDLGYSVTTNKNVAKWFTKTKDGSGITEHTISPNAKTLSAKDIPKELLDNFKKLDPNQSLLENIQNGPANIKNAERKLVAYARSKGYDAIDMRGEPFVLKGNGVLDNEAELRILNPKIIEDKTAPSVTQPTQGADPKKLYEDNLKSLKFFEQQNLNQFEGNAREAVNTIVEWHAKHSNPLVNYADNPQGLLDLWKDFRDTFAQVQQLGRAGQLTINGEKITVDNLGRVGIGKFGTEEKLNLVNALSEIPEQADRIKLINEMIADGYGWAQNPNMREAISAAVEGDNFAKDIYAIKTGKGVDVAGGAKFPRNYFPIYLSPSAKGYDSTLLENLSQVKASSEISDVLDRSVQPKAIAGTVGNFFTRIGLSPKDQQATAYLALRRNVAQNLLRQEVKFPVKTRGEATDSDWVLKKLGEASDGKKSVFDLRQLTPSEIKTALNVDSVTAGKIRAAITQAYLDIPLQVRGLGGKVQDINSKFNPFAKIYSRIQSAGRYAYNPFFVVRENIKTEFASQLLVGGKTPVIPGTKVLFNIFGGKKQQYDNIIMKLENGGFFSRGSGRDEFADGGLVGISAHLHPNQKYSAATMVDALATKAGVPVDEYLKENAPEVSNLIRWSVQYPKNSVLNSPLISTLNLVAFPARFNIKVATITARALAKQTPLTQVLVLNSLMHFGSWLNSDEGQQWQVQNTEALGVLKYFSPLESFASLSKILTGKADSINDYGQLGGLPFGVITTILQHQGVLPAGQPYINPRTGQPLPDYIPKTLKARAKSALDDLLGSVFSYPGATIGLGSKTTLLNDITSKAIPVKNSDKSQFNKVTPALDAQSQVQQDLIRRANGLPPTTDPKNPFQSFNIPPPEQRSIPSASELKPLIQRPAPLSKSAPPVFASVKPKGPKAKTIARPFPQ